MGIAGDLSALQVLSLLSGGLMAELRCAACHRKGWIERESSVPRP